jgi:hypothetical protein
MGKTIPKYMLCDACSAVTWHLDDKLRHVQAGLGSRKMKGYEVLEALEVVCEAEKGELLDLRGEPYDWGEYSVKSDPVKGKILAGPGCTVEDQNGFGQYGGFKTRLKDKCEEIIGREPEEDIYAAFSVRAHRGFARVFRAGKACSVCVRARVCVCVSTGRAGCGCRRLRERDRGTEGLALCGGLRRRWIFRGEQEGAEEAEEAEEEKPREKGEGQTEKEKETSLNCTHVAWFTTGSPECSEICCADPTSPRAARCCPNSRRFQSYR